MKTYLKTESQFTTKESIDKKTKESRKITICKLKAIYDGLGFPDYVYHMYGYRKYETQSSTVKSIEDKDCPKYAEKLTETRCRIAAFKAYKKEIKKALSNSKKEAEFLENLLNSVNNVIENENLYAYDLVTNEDLHKSQIQQK